MFIIRATREQKKKICHLFLNIDKLEDELGDENKPKYKTIKQIYIARDKAYGYIKSDGKIKFNIAGKGNYQDYPDALENFYSLLFKTKFSEKNLSKFAEESAFCFGIQQNIYLDSSRSSIFKGLKKFYGKETKQIFSINYNGLDIFIRYNMETDSYLLTNTRKLNLGMFGSYVNATPRKQKHKLILFITVPIENFDDLIEFVLDELYVQNSDSLFLSTEVKETKWIEFYKMIKTYVDDWRQSQYEIFPSSSYDVDDLLDFKYQMRKLCKSYGFDYNTEIKNEFYDLFERISLEMNLLQKISGIADKATTNLLKIINEKELFFKSVSYQDFEEDFLEVGMTVYELYLNIFTAFVKEANSEDNHEILKMIRTKKLPHFQGIEHKLFQLKARYEIRESAIEKLRNYFTLNTSKIKRDVISKEETFYSLGPKTDYEKQNDPKIKTYTSSIKERIKTDGMTYFYKIPVANLAFSNELKANLDRYYTANILNTIISVTKHYYYTHEKLNCLTKEGDTVIHDIKCTKPSCKVIKAIYSKKENSVVAPKKSNVVVIPLNFKILPTIGDNDILNNAELLDPNEIRKLEGWRWRKDEFKINKLVMVEKQKIIEMRHGHYFVTNTNKFRNWMNRYIKLQWKELKLFNKPWSVSIEKYNSSKFNATLTINIRPEKNNYFSYRCIIGNLHLNPMSFNLVNINLFETSIEECLDNTEEIKQIVATIFMDRDMHQFKRNQSLTIEDVMEKSLEVVESDENEQNQKFWRGVFYQWLAKMIILENLGKMQTKLTQLSISTQKEYDPKNKTLAINLMTDSIIKRYSENLSTKASVLLQDNKDLQVYPHKASLGVSMTNTKRKFSVSVYAKDKRWLLSKTQRLAKRRNLTDNQVQFILDTPLPDNIIRFEASLFGLETILEQPSANILEVTEKHLDKSFRIANKIFDAFEHDINDLYDNTPEFYYEPSYKIEDKWEDFTEFIEL